MLDKIMMTLQNSIGPKQTTPSNRKKVTKAKRKRQKIARRRNRR